MGIIEYDSAAIFIDSRSTVQAKIVAIDKIISGLELIALKGASTGNLDEYWLDDGQTKIKFVYRNMTEVAASINVFEQIRQRWINRLNGRITRRVPGKNFIISRNGRR